jgi:hypothetical protein
MQTALALVDATHVSPAAATVTVSLVPHAPHLSLPRRQPALTTICQLGPNERNPQMQGSSSAVDGALTAKSSLFTVRTEPHAASDVQQVFASKEQHPSNAERSLDEIITTHC